MIEIIWIASLHAALVFLVFVVWKQNQKIKYLSTRLNKGNSLDFMLGFLVPIVALIMSYTTRKDEY